MSDITITIKGDGEYPLDVDETLADLTGAETIMLEEYLGGWDKFDLSGGSTRSLIVCVWLAKRQAGKKTSLDEIGEIKGLVFGDALQVDSEDTDAGPPDMAAQAAAPSSSIPASSDTVGAGV